jgi:hypothetical protein
MVTSKVACVSCAARERDQARATAPGIVASSAAAAPVLTAEPSTESDSAYPRALLFGMGAAVGGLVFYASFTIITHMYIGYVALVVGLMVGKAVMAGSRGQGGLHYQITACALTYAAISLASIPILLSHVPPGAAINWAALAGPLLTAGIASPFLALRRGPSGIIGLVILFVGLRVAFRLTREKAQTAAVSSQP